MFNRGLSPTTLRLCCSLRLQRRYNNFRSALQKFLPLSDDLASPTAGPEEIDAAGTKESAVDTEESNAVGTDESDDVTEVGTNEPDTVVAVEIEAALKVLQTERMRKKAEEEDEAAEAAAVAESPAVASNDSGAVAMDQDENMVSESGQPQDPADDAFEVLVYNAIEEFGFAPRDVYNGVLKLAETKSQHAVQIGTINSSKLKGLVDMFSEERGLGEFSHHVVAVKPYYHTPCIDRWEIHFKSTRIARQVVELMRCGVLILRGGSVSPCAGASTHLRSRSSGVSDFPAITC